jgi:DNA adenine methylase
MSPLRYPGGKSKLLGYFSQLIMENSFYGKTYCEPYAGGAGLALKLLTHGYVERVRLNDIDPAIYAFWVSALFQPEAFCKLIEQTPISVEEWRRQREIYKASDANNSMQLGFAAYYLNRTSRSGIIDGSGPIGGHQQDGKWKIDARFNKQNQISNIKALSKFSKLIEVTNCDAIEFIQDSLDHKDTFLYLDPPYYQNGKKLYKNFYVHEDHKSVCALLEKNRTAAWIVSYDFCQQIIEIYRQFTPTVYRLQYSAATVGAGVEVIFASDSVQLPNFDGFKLAA